MDDATISGSPASRTEKREVSLDDLVQREDCTTLLGLDPAKVKVKAQAGSFDIYVLPACSSADAEVALLHLREYSPRGWNWTLHLGDRTTYDLYFVDVLIATGRRVRRRGGALTLPDVRLSAVPEPFAELFQKRCEEEGIVTIWHDKAA